MTTQTEALNLALEGGGLYEITGRIEDIDKCIVHRSVIREALAQPEQDKERCVGCEACIDTACGRDECPKGWPKAPQPEQEPVAWLHHQGNFTEACMNPLHDDEIDRGWTQEPLYITTPQPKEPEQRPVEWMPIEQMYPQTKAIDILMRDGSILCGVWPQFDGDLWWEGSGTGEKFIDPKYANVTHWRIHDEYEDSKTWVWLTDKDRQRAFESMPDMLDGFLKTWGWLHFAKAIEEISKEKNT